MATASVVNGDHVVATTLTQRDVDASIQQLSNIEGILKCAVRILDDEIAGSPLWEVSEAIHGAIRMVEESFVTLNDRDVTFAIKEG